MCDSSHAPHSGGLAGGSARGPPCGRSRALGWRQVSGAVVVGMVSGPVRRAVGAQRPPPPPCNHGPDTSLPTLPGPWEMRVRTRKRLNLPQQQPRLAGLGAQSRGRPPTAGCGTPGCWTWTSLLIVDVRDCSVIVHVKSTRRFSHEQEPGVRTTRLIPVRPPPRVLLAGSQSPHSSALGAVLAPPVAGTAQPWGLGTSANGTQKAVTFAFVRPRWGT